MGRIRERQKIHYEPSTKEVLACLVSMPKWLKLLLDNAPKKRYREFLDSLLNSEFINEETNPSIKQLSTTLKTDTTRATKYLKEIYNDIFELNNEDPSLFTQDKHSLIMYFNYYDDNAIFQLGVEVIPRLYETVRFYFMKARVGVEYFWVKEVNHEIIDNKVEISVKLQGGFLNKYREIAVDEALFKGWIGLMDEWQKHPFEINEILKKQLR